MKLNHFADIRGMDAKFYLIQLRAFTSSAGAGFRKKGGLKTKVNLTMLLKTHEEKLSHFGYATMCMKTK